MIRQRFEGPVKITFTDDARDEATISVDEGGERMAMIVHAVIEHRQGADGGMYAHVVFRQVEP